MDSVSDHRRNNFRPDLADKIASLNVTNPHSKKECTDLKLRQYGLFFHSNPSEILLQWKNCAGDAVEDDSKMFLAVNQGKHEFIMADIRIVKLEDDSKEQRIVLELFFDGETTDLPTDECKKLFIASIQDRISWTVDEYYRRVFKSMLASGSSLSTVRNLRRLDDEIRPVGDRIGDSFRDAGCMLRFIAVRISVTAECAQCIGVMVFPDHFGAAHDKSIESVHENLPTWIKAMGVSTVVIGIAMIYAWFQILVTGNSLS